MTNTSPGVFPFGRAVRACSPSASSRRSIFVLGAYPSALHVAWSPPAPNRRIQAIAVDNEPEPFWNGMDQGARVIAWKQAVRFDTERWGSVSLAGELNGSSGAWVNDNVLAPLGVRRVDAWITDALDTYRCSNDLAARLADTYQPFAVGAGLPSAALLPHPSKKEIIDEAIAAHSPRLRAELEKASPDVIVTLGNAALAVIRELFPRRAGADTRRLASGDGYGTRMKLELDGREVDLLPLAHPAAPRAYQEAHGRWRAAQLRAGRA